MFDKQIHRDDFRLRLLVTDGCNKSCKNCLNDFQEKPKDEMHFLDPEIAKTIIQAYCSYRGDKAQVEISGGEPGIYPYLEEVVKYAKECGAFVKVNTNGTAFGQQIEEFVDCWHIGVTGIVIDMTEDIIRVGGQVQFVVTHDSIEWLNDIVQFYGRHNIPIKLFVDFLSQGKEKEEIENAIERVIALYPDFVIKTRFVGVQENRGHACFDCNEQCITLKALWVFTDGRVSTCPQGIVEPEIFTEDKIESTFMEHAVTV